jgi:opacity protein-like surface antigen
MNMNTEKNVVILAAIAAALFGSDSSAEDQSATEREPIQFYFGLAFGTTDAPLRELYRVRAAQREGTSLQYLEPLDETQPKDPQSLDLRVGIQLTNWLDVELAWHDLDTMWQVEGTSAVFDPTLSGSIQRTDAYQYSRFEETVYSLSLLPRWNINDYAAIYARLGVGYADTMLLSRLRSDGYVSSSEVCTGEGNSRTCYTSYTYESRDWPDYDQKRSEFFPVAGIGVQLLPGIRLEYMFRSAVPIGSATTDISSLYLSFRVMTRWLSPR